MEDVTKYFRQLGYNIIKQRTRSDGITVVLCTMEIKTTYLVAEIAHDIILSTEIFYENEKAARSAFNKLKYVNIK